MTQHYLLIILNITVVFLAYIFIKKNLLKINQLELEIVAKAQTIKHQLLKLDEAHQLQLLKAAESLDLHKNLSALQLRLEKTNSDLVNSNKTIHTLEAEHKFKIKQTIEATRKETLKKSRAVLRGQASEHLAPYVLKGTNPKDYRFMGNPIDYVCFDGLSDVLDGVSNTIQSVRFIDIKTGKSALNKSQRRIRDAINDSRVTFSLINLDEEICKNDNQTKKEDEALSKEQS